MLTLLMSTHFKNSLQSMNVVRRYHRQSKQKQENKVSTINKLHVSARIDLSLYVT